MKFCKQQNMETLINAYYVGREEEFKICQNKCVNIKLAGLEISILEPGAISLEIARKSLQVHFFVHKFI